jgi:capsular exopolysaccharide synthesis family protein
MDTRAEHDEVDLRHWLHVLGRRKWTIATVTFVVVASALVASFLQTPVYRATAEMLIQSRASERLFDPSTGEPATQTAVQTEIEVLTSKAVQDKVRAAIGDAPRIHARQVGQTNVVEVSAESTIPAKAAKVANAYVQAYIEFRRTQAVDDLLAAGQEIQNKIADLQRQIDELDARVAAAAPAERAAVAADAAAQRTTLLNQLAGFKERFDQLQVDAALKSGGAQLVTPAAVPIDPVRPTPARNAALALAVGLMFGTGLALLLDRLDDSVKSKDDLERAAGVQVLALIPAVGGWRDRQEPRVVSLAEPTSPAAEAYRSLRTSLQFLALERPVRTLQVTSPAAAEGKTTTLANLAVALARAGQQVVVVCCDLRRPRVHEFFGLSNGMGFTNVLLGEAPLSAVLQEVPDVERLAVLASGPLPPNPSELLASRRTVEVLAALQGGADVVLVDSPPVIPVSDAAVLAGRVDATLLVATAGDTTRREVARAVELLRQVGAPLVGAVLNGVPAEGGYGYAYGYAYGYRYGQEHPGPAPRPGAGGR